MKAVKVEFVKLTTGNDKIAYKRSQNHLHAIHSDNGYVYVIEGLKVFKFSSDVFDSLVKNNVDRLEDRYEPIDINLIDFLASVVL